jgi:hypothetical protein
MLAIKMNQGFSLEYWLSTVHVQAGTLSGLLNA